uniref:Branched-chain amino acid transport system carrier protein n=1 Tax=Psychrobacter sp. (strain PRwf-1) TaxID=349106 RepID=A5WHH3_PSYWF
MDKDHAVNPSSSASNPLFLGFMLLSFFFGAGNLIFPPMLGMNAGLNFTPAVIGFIVTAIALPMLSLIAIAKSSGGLLGLGRRVHPVFAYVFAILIYLSIGAMYGIPRAANVGYEMGFRHFINLPEGISLITYVVVFFSVCYLCALKSGRLVDIIGKVLTPVLLGVIALLCGLAFMHLTPSVHAPSEQFNSNPLSSGIIEGYFTLDALAGLAFGTVLANAIMGSTKAAGQAPLAPQQLVKVMIQSSLVAGLFLGLIYFGLAWIGRGMYRPEGYENGAVLLSSTATQLMGNAGNVAFGMIVILACLTTCIGLINACSSFANQVYPKIGYGVYVLIFTVLGALFSNLGLDSILAIAVPIMVFLYPISIALVLLSLIHPMIAKHPLTYVFGVGTATLFAFNDMLSNLVSSPLPWHSLIEKLPMAELGLGWIVPTILMALLGFVIKRSDQAI